MDAQHQAALSELTQSVLANTDLSTLKHRATTLVANTLAVGYSAIWELLPSPSTFLLREGFGWQAAVLGEATVAGGTRSPLGDTVLSMIPVIVANWQHETRFDQPPLLRHHGVISSLNVVIPGQRQPVGILSVDATVSRIFTDDEIVFLQAIANVLASEYVRSIPALEQHAEQQALRNAPHVAVAQDPAVVEERQRLARDLHDMVIQPLYSITLHAQAARRLFESGNAALTADALRTLQDTAQDVLDELRMLVFELRPPILTHVGLVSALRTRLSVVEGRANVETRLLADGVGELPSRIEEVLYRIAQEALNNALKHARARHITVQLRQEEWRVLLEISDDGVGFDPVAASATGGLGLYGIAERVAEFDGTFALQSAPGAGTHVRVEVPL